MNAIDIAIDRLAQATATAEQCAENAAAELSETGKLHPRTIGAVTESLAAVAAWEAISRAAHMQFAASVA